MSDLYWITILGNINLFCTIITSFGFFLAVFFTIVYMCAEYNSKEQEIKAMHKKSLVYTWLISIITVLVSIFIPSKNDLYVIYGVGTTIDYLKENPTAQEIPDKCIKALDVFLDKQIEEK